jgi:hypothetical protein
MTSRILFALLLGAAGGQVLAQADNSGEIVGLLTDRSGGVLPGVRIEIAGSDNLRREGITDAHGRFRISDLPLGTYRVQAEIAGFMPVSGSVVLSQSVPRAHLAWRLELGCISDDVIVRMSPREAAASVDVIAHVRVTSAEGPVLFSTRPECEGKVRQSYVATVLQMTKGAASGRRNTLRLLLRPSDRHLKAGGEYVVLLWADGLTDDGLTLRVESGRVVESVLVPLGGMPVEQALKTLWGWARERRP